MTVNERLFVAGILDQFDDAAVAVPEPKTVGLDLQTVGVAPGRVGNFGAVAGEPDALAGDEAGRRELKFHFGQLG